MFWNESKSDRALTADERAVLRAIRDTALRQSHTYTDGRADYPVANAVRACRRAGLERLPEADAA